MDAGRELGVERRSPIAGIDPIGVIAIELVPKADVPRLQERERGVFDLHVALANVHDDATGVERQRLAIRNDLFDDDWRRVSTLTNARGIDDRYAVGGW